MGKQHLNYFHPFEGLPEGYENQLTRAALALMKLVPLAHGELLRRVDPDHTFIDLPVPDFDTQTQSLHPELESQIGAGALEDGEGPRVISVFLTPDVGEREVEVRESDRTAVFDGVIRYEDEMIIVIESKINESVDARQARDIPLGRLSGHCHLEKGVLVRWHDLVDAWQRLDEHEMLSFAESGLLNDFYEMAEVSFPDLLPFKSLSRAAGSPVRVRRRLKSLIEEAVRVEAKPRGTGWVAIGSWSAFQRIWFGPVDEGRIILVMWPGVQKREALYLYGDPARARAVAALDDTETGHARWYVEPSFSVSSWRPAILQSFPPIMSLDQYIDFWSREIKHEIRRRQANELSALLDWLADSKLATSDESAEFEQKFIQPRRNQIDLRPALKVVAVWERSDATELDETSQFVHEIREVVDTMLRTVGDGPLEL